MPQCWSRFSIYFITVVEGYWHKALSYPAPSICHARGNAYELEMSGKTRNGGPQTCHWHKLKFSSACPLGCGDDGVCKVPCCRVARAEGCCSYPYSCVLCNGAVLQGWAKVAAPPWQHTRLSCASAQVISSVFLFPPLWNWSLSWERRGGWKAGLAGWTHSYKVLHDVPWSSSVSLGVESEQVLDRLGQGYVVRASLPPATSQEFGILADRDEKQQKGNEAVKSPLQLLLIVRSVVMASLFHTN